MAKKKNENKPKKLVFTIEWEVDVELTSSVAESDNPVVAFCLAACDILAQLAEAEGVE